MCQKDNRHVLDGFVCMQRGNGHHAVQNAEINGAGVLVGYERGRMRGREGGDE